MNPKVRKVHALIAAVFVLAAVRLNAAPDPVLDWNATALQSVGTAVAAGRPGQYAFIDMAVVHAAIHDAVQAYDGRFRGYATEFDDADGSVIAAVAKAARDMLVHQFPAQTAALDTTYNTYLANNGLAQNDPGVAVGAEAAAGVKALRENDGSFPASFPAFNGGTAPGQWRPTTSYQPGPPPSGASMALPWLGGIRPLTLRCGSQFTALPPPSLKSSRYEKDYKEVKALGSVDNSSRTAEQTQIAFFWADNFLAQWTRVLRDLSVAHVDNLGDEARLFALAYLASGDALITAWADKLFYNFWRPVTAIQEGNNDGNHKTAGDPNWKPLINTPNYPDHTSGANNVSAALSHSMALFFGKDKMTFTVKTGNTQANPKSRTYHRFSDAQKDVVNARIYQGIHFRFADEAGRKQGKQVAEWVQEHFLQSLDDDDHGDHADKHEDDED